MKNSKRLLMIALAFALLFTLVGCGEFKVDNVDSITLSGPSPEDSEGISEMLTANVHSTDFYELIELCQGEELDSIEEDVFFGAAKITFTKTDASTVVIYPACDGSPYLCLNSLNTELASYIKLEESTMKRISAILKKHDITLA